MNFVTTRVPELQTIPDILRLQAVDQPNHLAVIDEVVGQITYLDFAKYVDLLIEDIKPYEPKRVALLFDRSVDYFVAYFAGLSIGAVLIPLDPALTLVEIEHTLTFCRADCIIYSPQVKDIVDRMMSSKIVTLPTKMFSTSDYNISSLTRLLHLQSCVNINQNNEALLLHTSGSLSRPKRVILTHRGLIENASAHAQHMGLTSSDRSLILLPMHFGYCNTAQILSHLLLGGLLVIMRDLFSPHRCLRMVEQYRVTNLTAVPTMLLQLQAFQSQARYDISSLQLVCFGGAPFPVERIYKLIHTFPHIKFCQTYGQTEAGPRITAVKPADTHLWPGSVGTTLPGVAIKLLKDDGQVAQPGENGEIIVQSPGLMAGYFGDPEATSQALQNGWLYTGDIGHQGPQGELYIVGRRKNFIIRGGINIYPEEIEAALLQHPAVSAALVTGVDHPTLGEVPLAKVTLADGAQIEEVELRVFAAKRLAAYKMPVIEIVDHLPRTYNGKVQRSMHHQ